MTKSTPPEAPLGPEVLLIEIDPSLIEEALASVDRAMRHAHPAAAVAVDDGADGEDIDFAFDPPATSGETDERRRLQFRVSEQQEAVRRLERELAKAAEARDHLDKQGRDLRKAHSDLSVDFERYRVRTRKDLEEAERRGEDRALRPMIEVFDNVERAWMHAVSDPAQILGGLQMIVEQFKRLLKNLGFERVDADRGAAFDPAVHEAVLHVREDTLPPDSVVDEVQAGFRLRGRLFRPARVTVSAPPPDPTPG
jgi:molecular chaperone GrpE